MSSLYIRATNYDGNTEISPYIEGYGTSHAIRLEKGEIEPGRLLLKAYSVRIGKPAGVAAAGFTTNYYPHQVGFRTDWLYTGVKSSNNAEFFWLPFGIGLGTGDLNTVELPCECVLQHIPRDFELVTAFRQLGDITSISPTPLMTYNNEDNAPVTVAAHFELDLYFSFY